MGIVGIFVLAIIAFIPARIAHSKGRSFGKWWVYGFFIWFFALVHSILLKKQDEESNKKVDKLFKIFIYIWIILHLIVILTTVVVIARNIITKNKNTTFSNDYNEPYIGAPPQYSFFTDIGLISTKTKDELKHLVIVDIILGYDLNDTVTQKELISKQHDLEEFFKQYFSNKYSYELIPENEELIKEEIRALLNTRFLDNGRIRTILFNKLDVYEDF